MKHKTFFWDKMRTTGPLTSSVPLALLSYASTSLSPMALHLSRLPTRTDLASPETLAGTGLLRFRKPLSVRCSGDSSSSSSVAVDSDFDAKVFRKSLTRSKNYNRRGFGHKEETLELMNREYTSRFNS